MRKITAVILVLALFTPSVLAAADERQLRISADSLKIEETTGSITFAGNVTVYLEDGTMTCDTLLLSTEPGDPSTIRTGTAEGNVVLTREGDSLRAGKAIMDMEKRMAVFSGSPLLSRGSSVMSARRITYYLDEGVADFDGPIEASFTATTEQRDR